jgi:ketosteroid isomerase-like protein
MSQENVELVRGQFEAWTRGDLAAVIERVDENGVVRAIIGVIRMRDAPRSLRWSEPVEPDPPVV